MTARTILGLLALLCIAVGWAFLAAGFSGATITAYVLRR